MAMYDRSIGIAEANTYDHYEKLLVPEFQSNLFMEVNLHERYRFSRAVPGFPLRNQAVDKS